MSEAWPRPALTDSAVRLGVHCRDWGLPPPPIPLGVVTAGALPPPADVSPARLGLLLCSRIWEGVDVGRRWFARVVVEMEDWGTTCHGESGDRDAEVLLLLLLDCTSAECSSVDVVSLLRAHPSWA